MAMKARYTVVEGEVVAEKRNGTGRRQYVPDPLGSTAALLDNTQTQTDTFQYWPYGEVSSRTGGTATPFQYVGTLGYYRDTATRNYVRARYLDVQAGRWVTQDPIGFDGGDLDLFRYAKTNPITNSDRMGTQVIPPNNTNWCGFARYGQNGGPVNCIDEACQRHDYCLATWKDCWRVGYCNAALCQAAKKCSFTGCGFDWRCRWVASQVRIAFCTILGADPFPMYPTSIY